MYGEDNCQSLLSSFRCPLNYDIQSFLHNKAISFAKQHLAMTFLVFTLYNNHPAGTDGEILLNEKPVARYKRLRDRFSLRLINKFYNYFNQW